MRMLLLLSVFGLIAVLGCQSTEKTPVSDQDAHKEPTSFTGTLQNGVMGIGGEHTGWILVGDGETGGIEVDVSNVKQNARNLAGKRVTIKGKMSERNYTERGKTPVLMADSIVEAPKSATNRPAGT